MLEGGKLDVGDDAKVVAAALEGLEEVGVLVLVGVDDLTRGDDNLEVDDRVRDKAALSREPPAEVSVQRVLCRLSARGQKTYE